MIIMSNHKLKNIVYNKLLLCLAEFVLTLNFEQKNGLYNHMEVYMDCLIKFHKICFLISLLNN